MVFYSELWIFILSAAIIMILMVITWHRRHFASGRAFLLLMLCALAWTINFTLEIAAESQSLKMLFAKFQFIAITFLPLAWLNLTLIYTGRARSRKGWFLLSVIPVMTNIMVWLVPQPNWFWRYPKLVLAGAPLLIMDYDYGFWFYFVHVPYSQILIIAALITLIRIYFKIHSIYRHQIILIIIAILFPMVTDIFYVLGYSPIEYFNFTTAVFSLSCLIIGWALLRHSFLDLLPMARDVVVENMDDGVLVLDIRKRLVDVNPAAMSITGISCRDVGRPMGEIGPNLISETIDDISRLEKKQREVTLGDGEQARVFDLRLSLVKDQIGQALGWVVTMRDCTERANLFKQIRKQAIFDDLTGIFNRRHFIELGEKELSRMKRNPQSSISAIMIDIDDFKSINDLYGHGMGDKVLVIFTEQCRESIRPYDIFGRLGGDEFAIILPNVTREQADGVVERLHKTIKKMRVTNIRQDDIAITASIGVASFENTDLSEIQLDRLLHLADEAMYASKKQEKQKQTKRRIHIV